MELIKIISNESLENANAVNARDLHEFLIKGAKGGQKGRSFNKWIIEKLDYIDPVFGVDYIVIEYDYKGVVKNDQSDNQNVKTHKRDYVLSLNLAKEISMIQNNDKGREARKYFIECEKRLIEVTRPKTRLELAREQLLLLEELESKEALLLEAKPKTDFFDKFMDSKTLQTATQVGQVLGISAITLNKFLEEKGIYNKAVKRQRTFQNWFIEKGFGKTIESERGFSQSLFTATGIDFVINLYSKT